MIPKYQVSVIIINFNSSSFTINCIDSILSKTNKELKYEIIIVDNNSKQDDFLTLKEYCNQLTNVSLIRSKLNLGFSGGNMLGVQYAESEYLFFLNNDTLLQNDCLQLLLNFMQHNQNVGVCTAQMYDQNNNFHCSFGYFPSLGLKLLGSSALRILEPNLYPSKRKVYTQPIQVQLVTGAAMFVNYHHFAKVGGFDTNYFLYCEEEDLAMKLKKKGFAAYLVPEAKFIHFMGKSTERNYNIEKEYYISLFYYLSKNQNFISYNLLKLYYFIKMILKFYKGSFYIKMAFAILFKSSIKNSLRHQNQLSTLHL